MAGSYHTPEPQVFAPRFKKGTQMTFVNRVGERAVVHGLLAAHALVDGLPPALAGELAQAAARRVHGDGETLFFEGDRAGHCLLVEQGAVEVLRYDVTGEERMLRRFGLGQLVAEAAMFMPHGLYPMTARARDATVVWHIPRGAWHAACERYPSLALRLLESLSLRLYLRVNEVDWLTRSNAPQRLAAYLLDQSSRQGESLELPTTQHHLAAHLGIRAETLSRILAEWRGQGWISGGRRCWRILQAARLRELVASL